MENKVFEVFDELGIKYEDTKHPALYTCADNDKYNLRFDGVVCKNLFIRNKSKRNYYLVSLPVDKRLDLKLLQEKLCEKKLSFASEEELWEKLMIKPGAVSLLNVVNASKTDVIFIIDKSVLNGDRVGFHPNVNTHTVLFSSKDIVKILNYYQVKYDFLDI